jgi:UDP-3-O-[3-hydroxymyristoyl] glucosamine N-acyltransferase
VKITLAELAIAIGAELAGDGAIEIESANTLDAARPGQISFLSNPRYTKMLQTTKASAVVVAPNVKAAGIPLLKHRNPYFAFSQAVIKLHGYRKHPHEGIHPRAYVDPTATIGENSVLYPGVYVGPRAKIGRDCILYPNVVIYNDCIVGDRVIIHANASIGQDGYGFAPNKDATGEIVHHKIPQVGNVILEDDVEIGANATVDRAALGSTIIGRGSKLGDLVTVGHNAKLGAHCLLVPQTGISGSTTLGHHVTMAGQSAVAGHLKIGDGATIGAQSGVIDDVEDKAIMIGSPAMPASHARRVYAIFTQLPELLARVKKLEGGGNSGSIASAAPEPPAEV